MRPLSRACPTSSEPVALQPDRPGFRAPRKIDLFRACELDERAACWFRSEGQEWVSLVSSISASAFAVSMPRRTPRVVLNAVVPWEDFRAGLSAVWRKPEEERKTAAGRKPWDEIVILQDAGSAGALQPL